MKRIGLTAILVIMGLIVAAASGCKKGEAPEEKAAKEMEDAEPKYDNSIPGEEGIKNAIRGYNQAVIHGNMKTDYLKFVRKYAVDYEASRVVVFVQEDRAKGRVMRSRLNKLIFDNFSTSGDMTFARTTEMWEYDYLDLNTGKLLEPLKGVEYRLKYTLARDKERWLVGRIEQLEQPLVTVYSPPRALDLEGRP